MIEEQGDTERVSREIQILKKVRHPNIIQLYEVKKNTIIVFPPELRYFDSVL